MPLVFRYALKTSENQRFSEVFREYRKRAVAWNGLSCNSKTIQKLSFSAEETFKNKVIKLSKMKNQFTQTLLFLKKPPKWGLSKFESTSQIILYFNDQVQWSKHYLFNINKIQCLHLFGEKLLSDYARDFLKIKP